MKKILVVGHGIAGALLSHQLRNMGADVFVADDPRHTGSSGVAAGIINPVTGKRYAKSWNYDVFWEFARRYYRDLEQEFQIHCLQERSIIRLLGSPEEANNWSARSTLPEFEPFIGETSDAGVWQAHLSSDFYLGQIKNAAQVDFQTLLNAFQSRLLAEQRFWSKEIGPDDWQALASDFDGIVFCQGARAVQHALFPEIRWQTAKGEGLLVRFEDPALDQSLDDDNGPVPMLKKDLVIASPGGKWRGLSWVGASFYWDFEDDRPTETGAHPIEASLKKMVSAPYRIEGHFAGVRPVVTDRRPVLGQSEKDPRFFIFNALGAKGGLLAPWFSKQMAERLLLGKPADQEVALERFR